MSGDPRKVTPIKRLITEGARQISVQYDVDFDRFIKLFVERVTRK